MPLVFLLSNFDHDYNRHQTTDRQTITKFFFLLQTCNRGLPLGWPKKATFVIKCCIHLHYVHYMCTTTWVIVKVLLCPLYNQFIVTLLSQIILVLWLNRQAQIQLVIWQRFCGSNLKNQINLNHNTNLQYQHNTANLFYIVK